MEKHLKIVLLLSSALIFHSNVFAIEREDLLHYQTSSEVIVRDLGNNTYMICDQHLSGSGNPTFMKVTVGNTLESYIVVDVDSVYDFEVLGGIAYFCGVKGGRGILGYFPYASLSPSVLVQYLAVPTSQRLRKIEVGTMAGQTHMVAIGDGLKGNAEIVDAIDMVTSWGMHFFDATDAFVMLSDLAITDKYVVVSFYNKTLPPDPSGIADVKVLFLDKPTIYGSTFSYWSFPWRLAIIQSVPRSTIEACEKDAFVVAAHAAVCPTGTYSVFVSAFTGMNLHASIWINEPTNARVSVKDLRYYKEKKITELLLDFYEEQDHRSVVYHLESNMTTGTHTAKGHWFDGVYVTSLYTNSLMPEHFFAAGTKNSWNNIELFLYHYNQWGTCTDYEECTTKAIEKCDGREWLSFERFDIEQIPLQKYESSKGVDIENKCMSN